MTRTYLLALVFSVLLAVGAPLVNAYIVHGNARDYDVVQVDIEPYDPRDILRGHYLRFRIDWNLPEEGTPSCKGKDCCLCLGKEEINPSARILTCDAAQEKGACTHFVQGSANGREFFGMPDRFYVDEKYALPLEKVFADKKEKFRLELSMRPGKPVIRDLFIGDRPYRAYVAEEGAALRGPETP